MFNKVLVANRGEIAVRIFRALKEMSISSVAVHARDDTGSLHTRMADESHEMSQSIGSAAYLDIDAVLDLAQQVGADAIHPGYGFLAENATFAGRCADLGITFIGPPADAIARMARKTQARKIMNEAGVPVIPGTLHPITGAAEAAAAARSIGFPVAVKAAAGGGGKGFRVARDVTELPSALAGAADEGRRFFGDESVYLERYFEDPRHVEVQILADEFGDVVHLGERDCSVQRRHQKLIEEAPGPVVDPSLRAMMGEVAVEAARAVGYRGAGTVEGLLHDGSYYFMEMNTRIQVEHGVTEAVTGIDIVKEGIRIAAGEPLSFRQDDVEFRGHAIECRINAEDAARNFLPAPGRIETYRAPSGPGVRVDSGVEAGSEVLPSYDSMIAKLIVWDRTRHDATLRMIRALDEFSITGVRTLIPFHRALLHTKQWESGETCRGLIGDKAWLRATQVTPGGGSPVVDGGGRDG
ncbi:acetyl/propionyl/methylcrotonyl-CoA carboxylase subunit alpha [Pseudonocardia sp. N23]|uniref:acetyl-CoA carboxylase biotin carboxylase subunit n=1 Tax=Pseudonocardia sp. N23 TaxID=1987376 RepID=UPI000BFC7FFA|nr:acetyl-CoA carboxylase biotin carboxylase subunit [Pseudonocardia sp. N23]